MFISFNYDDYGKLACGVGVLALHYICIIHSDDMPTLLKQSLPC